MSRQEAGPRETDQYTIRPYRPGDRDDFLDLYGRVLGEAGEDWFAWKYEDNPYVDHVPMIVAVADGRVVGTKPAIAFRLAAGDRTVLALQPADVMVHPDHRRRGLYSRTTERLKTHYADREPAMFFNFPNAPTLSGSLKHGWRLVEAVRTYYRVNDPRALASSRATTWAARAARPGVRAYLGARERLASGADVAVRRHRTIPGDLLTDLYRRRVPDRFHAVRDETYYDWRFRNPRWDYTAYTAHVGGSASAGVVVGRREADLGVLVALVDVVPLAGASREGALATLLGRVVADHEDADVLTARGGAFPEAVLHRFGFYPDDTPLLSRLTAPTHHVAYPLTDGDPEATEAAWRVAGRDIVDPERWALTLGEADTY